MTVAQVDPSGNLPATVGDVDDTGLGDLDASDFVIPRLQIEHKEGKFKDNLSNEEFQSLDLVILGLVKQRIMWAPTIETGDKPLCKSPNFDLGFPNLSGVRGKSFPFDRSNFTPETVQISPSIGGVQLDTNGHGVLPCASCKFKEWETHPNGKVPWCSEQHTLPVMYREAGTDKEWVTALLTLQKTGITPSKRYLTSFARSKTPAYTAITRVTLTMMSRGDTVYSVPGFQRIGDTDRQDWPEYAESYKSIRDFVRSAPRAADGDDDDSGDDNVWGAPPEGAPTQAAPAQPAAQNDDPWASTAPATPPPAAQPVAQPVAPPPPPAPAPAPEPTVAVPVAPVAPAPAPTPAPAPAAQPVTAPPVEVPAATVPAAAPVDDDLPF